MQAIFPLQNTTLLHGFHFHLAGLLYSIHNFAMQLIEYIWIF